MARFVAPALRALLRHSLDYAGMFPPASLDLTAALKNYARYRQSDHSWMLGRFVIAASDLRNVAADVDYAFAVLADTDHPRAEAIESRQVIATSKPTYCEVPAGALEQVAAVGSFAKIRTGSLTADAIPLIETLAEYIGACLRFPVPFKATAGLHHPIRGTYSLTYAADPPLGTMHGFMNVLLAAVFAWRGAADIKPILAETNARTFRFDENAHWRDLSVTALDITDARTHFIHSFGSCSFEEPIDGLRGLGWL